MIISIPQGPGRSILSAHDILDVVGQYHRDDNDDNPGLPPYVSGYNPETDRTALGTDPWSLGKPNGQQRVDDILASVKQYHHDLPVDCIPDAPMCERSLVLGSRGRQRRRLDHSLVDGASHGWIAR